MVLAQFVIATPLVVGFTAASIQALPAQLPDLLTSLGAGRLRKLWILSREARLGLLAAVMAGFGAIVSEVGASMTVGGNLRGSTRVLTTAIVTETSRGNLPVALALGAPPPRARLRREPSAHPDSAAPERLMDVAVDGLRFERERPHRARYRRAGFPGWQHHGRVRAQRLGEDHTAPPDRRPRATDRRRRSDRRDSRSRASRHRGGTWASPFRKRCSSAAACAATSISRSG